MPAINRYGMAVIQLPTVSSAYLCAQHTVKINQPHILLLIRAIRAIRGKNPYACS